MVKQIANLAALQAEFDAAGGKAVLIDFFATWCGPCKAIAPKLEQFSVAYPNVIILKVDVDDADDVAQKYEISAMPTFKVFKNGQPVDSLCGADAAKLEAMIKKYN